MFSRIRRHVNGSTVVASIALVFAMTGGAYAASRYVITSTKQISPKVLKSLQGRAGTAGRSGANGANGAPGEKGPQGPAGVNGAAGESVSSATLKNGEGGCAAGGSKFTVGGKEASACNGTNGKNGVNGTTGFTETLPPDKTETGTWAAAATGSRFALASISFPIPLAKPLGGSACQDEEPACPVHYVNEGEKIAGACEGSVGAPTAEPGDLCVYEEQGTGLVQGEIRIIPASEGFESLPAEHTGAGTSGALLVAVTEEGITIAHGTWAVTAPEEG